MNPRLRKGLLLAIGLGAGIGLMAGSVLVAVADNSRPTDAQIRQRATDLGMVDLATYQPPVANVPAAPVEPAPAPPAPPPKEYLVFTVVRGMGYVDIGRLLNGAGLPINPVELSDRAEVRKLGRVALPGVYKLLVNDPDHPVTLDAVIDLVTGKTS